MKRWITFIFLILLACGIFTVLILLRPSLWTGQLLSYFNNQLEDRYNIHITASELTGNILNNLSGNEVTATTFQDSTFFTADGLTIRYSLWKIVIGEFAIDEVRLSRPVIRYSEGLDLLARQIQEGPEELTANQSALFTINRISVDQGRFIYRSDTNQMNVNEITGELQIAKEEDALTITGDFSSIQPVASRQTLRSVDFLVRQYPDSVIFDHAEFMYDSASVSLSGIYIAGVQPHLRMNYNFSDISAGAILEDFGIDFPANDQWDITGNMYTDFSEFAFETAFSGNIYGTTNSSGQFEAVVSSDSISVVSSDFRFNDGTVQVNGQFTSGVGGSARVQMDAVNLSDIYPDMPSSILSGSMEVVERSGTLSSPDASVTLDFTETSVDGYDFSNIAGQVNLRNDTLELVDTVYAQLADASLQASGWYALDGSVDGMIDITAENIGSLSAILNGPDIRGGMNAHATFHGTLDTMAVTGRALLSRASYHEVSVDTAAAYFNVQDIQHLRNGNLFAEIRNGNLYGKPINQGSLSIEGTNDSLFVHGIQFSDDRGNFYATGNFDRTIEGSLDTVTIRYDDTYIHNRVPIPVNITNGNLEIRDGILGVNDGFLNVSATIQSMDSLDTELEFTSVDLGPLNALLATPLPITGRASGEMAFRRFSGERAFRANLEISNAIWRDMRYNRIQMVGNYFEDLLTITKGTIVTPQGGELTVSGKIPLSIESSLRNNAVQFNASEPLSADIRLRDIQISDYSWLLGIRETISGMVSGNVVVTGSAPNPLSTMELTVANPRFDKVGGDELNATIQYSNDRLTFKRIQLLEDDGGEYTGEGYLPILVDFESGTLRLMRDEAMDLHFQATAPTLQFLEAYIADLDGLTGECELDLYVTGTPNNPIRDGQATLSDVVLEISDLENEVTNVQADFTLRNNMMTVDNFAGYMYNSEDKEVIEGFFDKLWYWVRSGFRRSTAPQEPNVFVEGQLNFREFFKPGLDLSLTGEDVYIRTLLSEVEGLVNPTITLTGKDSLMITGDLGTTEELVLRKEFADNGLPENLDEGQRKQRYVDINLHADFPGNVYIKNSQVDAEFEGEIWLIQHGNESLNLSGTLTVINGKFYYYNDTFTIEQGEIIFDPVEFNPRLNIVATTEVNMPNQNDSFTIRIILTGELDNPNIALESTGNANVTDNLSESDLLSLLTFNAQIEEEGLATPEIQSIFTTYLERQLENYGTQLMGFETFEVETQGQSLQNLENLTITVGQRVAPNLYFMYGREFSAETPRNRVGLEYQVNNYISLVGEVDEDGLYHFNYRLKYNY